MAIDLMGAEPMPSRNVIRSALRHLRALGAIAVASLVLSTASCASDLGTLRMVTAGEQTWSLSFEEAYIRQTDNGEYEIIMIDDPLTDIPSQRPGAVLQPIDRDPLRQTVAVRVRWRPTGNIRSERGINANAAVDWYITGMGADGRDDLAHYTGVATVRLHFNDEGATVRLRHGRVELQALRGRMQDTIESARLDGTLFARWSDEHVEKFRAELDAAAAR